MPAPWMGASCVRSTAARLAPVHFFLSGFLFFPLHFVCCVQQAYSVLAFLVAERGHLSRRRGNLVSGSAAD